jgi:hypothetical protein
VGLVISAVAVASWATVVFIRTVLDVPRQAYAVWQTADLVIAYMERHDGAWPRSWEDLRPLAMSAPDVSESEGPDGSVIIESRPKASIEELQSLVEVDWGADPGELLKLPRKGGALPFRVIYLRNGKSTHYEGREPNQMILAYLESRQRRKAKSVAEPPAKQIDHATDG